VTVALTVDSLRNAVTSILAALETEHERLTTLDGQIGDGDLGITLIKAFRELDRVKGTWPDDVGMALMQGAQAVSKVSSSSFGTLLATSMMAVAKPTRGTTEVAWSEVPGFFDKAVEAMMSRGKASLGDKTVMDAVSGAAAAGAGKDDPAELLAALRRGTDQAMDEFRDRPNKIGRARIFAERTVGMDDPGMVAFKVMIYAI
jgi:dihydroxyacetone kinase-like protein